MFLRPSKSLQRNQISFSELEQKIFASIKKDWFFLVYKFNVLTHTFLLVYINRIELVEQDEFLILGCDGIWDCLTNEKAVEYVRCRIDTMLPTEIGVQMLNDIISEDPRATQGIGGDNMTVMIIDFKPHTRSHRKKDDDTQEQLPEPVESEGDSGGGGGGGDTSPSKL